MDEQYILDLFNELGGESTFGKFDDFKELITTDPAYQKDVYDTFGKNTLGEFDDFKSLVSVAQQTTQQQPVKQTTQPVMQLPLKKKEGSTSPSGIGTLESSGIKLTNVRKALGQEEEQQPIMMQRVRPETTAEADETWRRKPKFDFMPDFNKPAEEDRNLVERPAELGFIGRYTPERDKEKTPQFVEEALGALTLDTFKKKSADSSKKELEYYLKDMGFKIEESAGSNYYTGRYVDVISPRGERYPLYLGNDLVRQETLGFAGLASEEDIEGLKNFVRVETFSDPGIAKKQYLYEKENQKFKTKENIDTEVSKLSQDAEALKNEMNNFMANRVSIQEMVNKIEAYPENLKGSEQYNKLVEEYNKMLEDDKKASTELENKRQSIIANDTALKAAAGNYVKFREGQGSFQRAMWNKAMGGAGKVLSGLYDLQIEQSLNSGITGLIGNYIIGEEWDKILKAIKYGEYDGEKVLPFNPKESLRGIFTKLLGDTDVTEEYVSKIEREGNIVQRGILGLAESAPAMIGGPVSPVLMGAMVTDALDQEMMNDPDLKDLSEMEKMMIKAPIGIVSGILEKVGLKGALKGTALVKTLTGRAISKLPINATAAELRNATLNEIKNMGIKSSVALVGSALSEAETGALQQVAEYGIKDIYNLAKGKEMFDTPEFFSQKYFNNIIDAALTEAVGGVVIGVPNSIAAAFKKDGFRGLDDETFKIFEQLAKDNDSRKFFVTDLKNKINSGQITGAQGKEIINAYDQAAGMIGTVDDEITDVESRKIAMDLISERKKLEAKRDKMDPGLAKPIQKRIDQINEQLSQLTEDAIQKQTTGEVSVQPEAGAGQEVEIGGPEAKPQITPEESKRKEDLIAALEATDKDIITIGDEMLDRKEAQTELEAIIAKEQAVPAEQGGAEQAPAKLTPEESKRKEGLVTALSQPENDKGTITIDGAIIDRKEAQAELEAITQKEQVAPAKGLGTQLEMVAKEEQAPAKMTTTEVLTATPTETKANVTFIAPDGNEVALEGNEQVAAQLYDEAVAVAEEQRTPEQNDIIQKMQPIVAAAPAVEVTPTEVTPVEQFTEQDRARKAELEEAMRKADKRRKNITVGETTMSKAEAKAELDALVQKEQAVQQPVTPAVEVAPIEVILAEEVVERTSEQEADLLEELLAGKKKEPTVTPTAEVKAEPTSKEAIAKRLRGKKNKGLMSSIDFGISQALYNGALEFMASQVEKDTKLGNAIANTIKWIDERMQGKKWNKGAFGKYMNDTYKVTLGDGRQVDVLRDDSKETAEVINGWYQPIEQKIIDSKQDKQTANKWAEQLRSKEDEDLWTGVREFLESKGNQSVSKKELLDFMKDNRVEIVEVVKGEKQKLSQEAMDDVYNNINEQLSRTNQPQEIKDFVEEKLNNWYNDPNDSNYKTLYNVLGEANMNLDDFIEDAEGKMDDTKYSLYQLPGDKSDYKEVLVTMPRRKSIQDHIVKNINGQWVVENQKTKVQLKFGSEDLAKSQAERLNKEPQIDFDKEFKSSHFDEPNILVHLRMNTRTDADGNKVLFLEEIQSDWGQKGKKEGFENPAYSVKLSDKEIDGVKLYDILMDGKPLADIDTRDLAKWYENKYREKLYTRSANENQANEVAERLNDALTEGKVPTAPFVMDTNAWVKLGLKMALREAAAQGADKIAWTTGEQQNARYDLSEQVNKIDVEAVAEVDGLYFVDIELSSGTTENLEVENGVIRGGTYSGQRLENVIGKEYADKILSTPKGESVTLQGPDLKLGGKGMKGFYDGIVPNVAKALIKEITGKEGKITEVKIDGNNQQAIDVTPEMKTQAKTALPLFSGSLADAIVKNLTIKTGGLQSNILGIPIAIWNSGVLTAAKAIDASVVVSKAIQQGANDVKNWIKKNNPSLSLSDAKIKNKILIDLYENTIKIARENNVKTEGLITYFKRKGLSDAQINVLLKDEKRKAEKPELSEDTLPGYTKLMNRINDIIARGRRNGKSDDVIMQGVIANVESRSPEYANATDQQREQIIRDIRKLFGKKEKAAPSAEKITGKPKPKKVLVDDMASLKDQIRLEVRAAREAKGDLNAKRKMLTAAIKEMVKKGKITVRQAAVLINRVNAVNLDNPVMVERLLDYAEKVFNDAAYAEKLSQANKLQSQIKQLSKSKDKFGNLTAFAAEFAKIDPSLVENIDEYIEMASKVKEGVQGSKTVNGKVIPADMVDVGKAMEYVNKTMKAQEETIRLKTAERLQELIGVDVSDLSMAKLQELMELVKAEALATGDQKKDLSDKINDIFGTNKDKEKAIRDGIQRMFDTYSTIIKDMFETGVDPFSDPDNPTTVEFKESDKKIAEEFIAMDLSLLDKKEALRAADALNNFLTNKSTAGMAAMLGEYDGRKNSKEVNEKGIRAKPIKMYWVPILGRSFYEQFASIPLFFEKLFKGVTRGNYVREKMGINSLINHKAEALTLANRIINNYVLEFTKKKPNNKKFQDIYNIIERGIIGDLAKTIVGDAKQVAEEFNRRKKLIEETIQILEKGGTKKETKEAKVIKEVYDKIAKDSKTIEEVKAKADQTNVAAVQFWVDQWAKLYDQFADVALNVYNRVLDKSVNYVPDRFGFLERAEKVTKDADGFESMFFANSNSEYFYKKEAGSLMKSQPPKSLFKDGESDMYVNLSFDTNNANALLEALIDIKTARDIRQIQAFKNDPNFKEIVPNGNDSKVLKERISALIRNIRNKRIITDKTFRQLTRNLDRFASFGAALALAGPTQAIKQTIPVAVNTLFNAGSLNLSVINNKDVKNFINNSGMAIANRGLDATTELETLNQKLEQTADTKAGDLVRAVENINKKFLKVFLSNFDVFIARASWITYYEKSLRKQNIKGKIDYSTHKINQQAADYAQTMVDRQQNISDKDLAGRMYESGNPMKQFIVKVFLPLATFRMNQTTRMMNDVTVITSKTSSLEDKKIALRSFAGYAAEMATFRAIGIGISYGLLYSIAQFIRGEDEDEEEKQKKFNNLIKGAATSVVSDVFSPMPQADMPVKYLFSSVLDQIQSIGDIKEEDRLNIFTENKESLSTAYGMFGIGLDKFNKLWEDIELGVTGKFKDDYGREKTIREKDRELLSNPLYVAIHLTSDFGISPFGPETNNVMNNITKMIKKDAMTEKQLEEYKETGEYPTKKSEAAKEEEKVSKAEAYGNYKTLEEFEKKDPIKYDEYSAKGGKLYKYREDERKEFEEKNKDKPFFGHSEKKFKELYPKDWAKYYGPGTAYFQKQNSPAMLQKKAQEEIRKAQLEQKRKIADAKRKQQEALRKALGK